MRVSCARSLAASIASALSRNQQYRSAVGRNEFFLRQGVACSNSGHQREVLLSLRGHRPQLVLHRFCTPRRRDHVVASLFRMVILPYWLTGNVQVVTVARELNAYKWYFRRDAEVHKEGRSADFGENRWVCSYRRLRQSTGLL